MHERVRHDTNNRAPWSRLGGVENANAPAKRTVVAKIFLRETGVHNCDRLLVIGVFNRKVASFQHFQTEGRKVIIGNSFGIALGAISVGHVGLAVDFVLAKVAEGHSWRRYRTPDYCAAHAALS